MGGWWRWVLVSPDGVAPSQMVGVSASVNLSLHRKVQKFSSGNGSSGCPRKRAIKWLCGVVVRLIIILTILNFCYLVSFCVHDIDFKIQM